MSVSVKNDIPNHGQEEIRSLDKAAPAFHHEPHGVVIGVLVGINEKQNPMVVFPANPDENAVPARTTVPLQADDIGREVALLFEQGDPARPLIIGPILKASAATERRQNDKPVNLTLDDEHLVLNAKQSITLKCG